MLLGTPICEHCGRSFTPDSTEKEYSRRYCTQGCFEQAKRKRDRLRKRSVRGGQRSSVDPGEFIAREPAPKRVPDIQPRAYSLVQDRSAEFIKSILPEIETGLAMFCFMRGYNELDRIEILKHLRGETRVAPEEIPPDPPVEFDLALIDPFGD